MDIRSLCRVLFAVLLVCGFAYQAVAEETPIGRDHKGQAYRTDASGFRIVDHVAELEVTVDDLQRQVRVLEDELEHKQRILQRSAPQAMLPGVKLKESDIMAVQVKDRFDVRGSTSTFDVKGGNLQNTIKELESKIASQNQLKQQNDELVSELASLRQHLVQNTSQSEQFQNKEAQLRDQQNELKQQLSQLRQQRDQMSQEAKDKAKLETSLQALQGRMSQQDHALKQKTSKYEQLQAQLAEAQTALNERQARQEELAKELQQKSEEASKLQTQLAVVSETAAAYQTQALKRGRLATKKEPQRVSKKIAKIGKPELFAGRKQINASLKKVQQLVFKRKNMADSLRKSQSSVSVSLSPLKTTNGITLDRLRAAMKNMDSVDELQQISSGVAQIEALLNDDIRVMKRLSRM